MSVFLLAMPIQPNTVTPANGSVFKSTVVILIFVGFRQP
jgi:hypothetical protein